MAYALLNDRKNETSVLQNLRDQADLIYVETAFCGQFNLKFQISDLKFQISNFKFEKSGAATA